MKAGGEKSLSCKSLVGLRVSLEKSPKQAASKPDSPAVLTLHTLLEEKYKMPPPDVKVATITQAEEALSRPVWPGYYAAPWVSSEAEQVLSLHLVHVLPRIAHLTLHV